MVLWGKMKKAVLFVSVLFLASTIGSTISLYKPLLTEEVMSQNYDLMMNKFVYSMQRYNRCNAKYKAEIDKVELLKNEIQIILTYNSIVGGSLEAQENFEKWKLEFEALYPVLTNKLNQCYMEDSASETGS